jgi:hypothetical protein
MNCLLDCIFTWSGSSSYVNNPVYPLITKFPRKKGKYVPSKLDLSLFHKRKFVGSVLGLHLNVNFTHVLCCKFYFFNYNS